MRCAVGFSVFFLSMAAAQMAVPGPGGAMSRLAVTAFAGSGVDSIRAIRTDAAGYVYVAGTTSSFDFPVRHAAQSAIGEVTMLRSVDGGGTWTRLSNPAAPAGVVVAHPRDLSVLLTGTQDGIYRSTDGGRTWTRTYSWAPARVAIDPGACCFSMAIDPVDPRWVYVSAREGSADLLVSSDNGVSWKRGGALPQFEKLWVDPHGSGMVAAGTSFSRDRGMTWTAMPGGGRFESMPDLRRPGWIYVMTRAGASGGLRLSKDYGVTWVDRPSPVRGDDFHPAVSQLVFDPDLAGVMYAGSGFGDWYVSRDDGATWRVYAGFSGEAAALSRQCNGGGGLFLPGLAYPGFETQPHIGRVPSGVSIAAGPACSLIVLRSALSDAFVAKLSPAGDVLWSTYLGGESADTATALAVDAAGNVYVTGITRSGDFAGLPESVRGFEDGFAVSYSPEGRMRYAVVFGGSQSDAPSTIAVSREGETHVVGWTYSSEFPVSAGAWRREADVVGNAFAVKLSAGGEIIYSTYLPELGRFDDESLTIVPPRVVAAVVEEATGGLLAGGADGRLLRLSPDGSSGTWLAQQPGRIFALESGADGSVYVAGASSDAPESSPCFQGFYQFNTTLLPGDSYLRKLRSGTLEPVWHRRLAGECRTWPGSMQVQTNGQVTLGLWSFARLPMVNPVLPFSNCGLQGSAAVVRVSADGAGTEYASFIDVCSREPGLVAAASADGGDIWAAASMLSGHTAVVRMGVPASRPGISIDTVTDAFSGGDGMVRPGRLLRMAGRAIADETVDLGLNYSGVLPAELAGVRVLFDGEPGGLFRVSPESLICAVPGSVAGETSVQVVVIGPDERRSPAFLLPAAGQGAELSLLTRAFPDPPRYRKAVVDGNVRNADGSVNGPANPAAVGSVVTLFGMGAAPGEIALLWNAPVIRRNEVLNSYFFPASAEPMPGFLEGLRAIRFRIPSGAAEGSRGVVGRVDEGLAVYVTPTDGR